MKYKSPMAYFIEALGYMGYTQLEVDTDKSPNTWPELEDRQFTLVQEMQEDGINWCITFNEGYFGAGYKVWFNFDKAGACLGHGMMS